MESLWSKQTQIEPHKPLYGDKKVQAAVIGGGLAGILTAYFLRQKGVEAIVLETSRIGSGQTKNTTAKITSQHGLIYQSLIKIFGHEKAKLYAQGNEKAITEYRRIIKEKNISCDLEELPAYLYTQKHPQKLEEEAQAAASLGIGAQFTQRTSLPFETAGAVRFERQAQFSPLAFLKEISKDIPVYENTRVVSAEEHTLVTSEGMLVTAEHIIFTTHYPFVNVPGYYFMRMHQQRSYVIALENAQALDGMYLGTDKDGLSLRTSGNLLLLGGAGHRTGENSAGGSYKTLRQKAKEYWPESAETAYWSAQDCMTPDHVPYIGRYSPAAPGWYVATGFNKWGMTSSMLSAMILSDSITGEENPYAEIFCPQRFEFSPCMKTMLTDGAQAVKGLAKELFYVPKAEIDRLPNGHGGVVEYEGEKIGVYKNEDGEPFFVSTRCPHLGCQLEWNPDELSWDCPCHGSRFDYKGALIDNPAQEDINHA